MIPISTASRLATVVASLFMAAPAAAEPAAPSLAQSAARAPADARASVPPVHYRSAFSDYRPLSDDKVGWKEANDEVGRIGGWRAYAREANAPESPSSAPSPAAAPGAAAKPKADAPSNPEGHGAHGKHETK